MSKDLLQSLKSTRQKAGLTQKDVEHELGMRSLMMRDYEVGRLKLPITVALELAKLYNTSLDELVGKKSQEKSLENKVLTNFHSLFLGNGFSMMFLDPILRAYLEDHQQDYFDHSLFELLTKNWSEKHRHELINELMQVLFSVASSDGKITNGEIKCLKFLLLHYNLQKKYQEFSRMDMTYLPSSVPKRMQAIEIRHFVIWILFFFAYADGALTHHEIEYIEAYAQKIKMNRSNFLFIKEKFVKENL